MPGPRDQREGLEQGRCTLVGRGSDQGILKQTGRKSVGPVGMHPQVLRELADVIARTLLIVFDWSWWLREVLED